MTNANNVHGIAKALAIVGFVLLFGAGLALRLTFPNDIEYKADEAGYVESVQGLRAGHSWPRIGPAMSVLLPSPGMGLGTIYALALLSGAETPPEIARSVQLLNVAALLGFLGLILVFVPRDRRELWLWSAVLWAANPIAIILERKIWPVSALPAFTVVLLIAWWNRQHVFAAFAWGLVGAVMSQVHVGAMFFAIALVVWTAGYDWRTPRWSGWLLGSFVGGLSAIPWLFEVVGVIGGAEPHYWRWPIPSFFLRWVTQPFGFGIEYTLGSDHTLEFLSTPVLGGSPIFLMGVLYAIVVALWGLTGVGLMSRVRRLKIPNLRAALFGYDEASVLIRAAFLGYGGMLTLITIAGADSHRHYMIVIAPIMALWAVRMIVSAFGTIINFAVRSVLTILCLCQVGLAFGLLTYIHQTGNIRHEFGPTWQYQRDHCSFAELGHAACLNSIKK